MNPYVESFHAGAKQALDSAKGVEGLKDVVREAAKELDILFAEELSRSGATIACCDGCFFCCYLKVDVQPGDVFVLADFIRSRFSAEQQKTILQKARENWAKIAPMSARGHSMANLPCPLLLGGRCSVYSVRPLMCRQHHSRRVEPCKESFENPDTLELSDEVVPQIKIAAAGAIVGFTNALKEKGLDSQAYDINASLIEALTNPRSEKRWRDGKSAFPKTMLAKNPPAEPHSPKQSPVD